MQSLEICIDFDGTCVTHDFPKVGNEIGAVPVLKELVAKGHKLILFTMRSDSKKKEIDPLINPRIVNAQGNHLSNAIDWFKKHEIPLYGIQANPTQYSWTSSPKAYGQLYIDDAALGCPLIHCSENGIPQRPYVDWQKVREILIKDGIL